MKIFNLNEALKGPFHENSFQNETVELSTRCFGSDFFFTIFTRAICSRHSLTNERQDRKSQKQMSEFSWFVHFPVNKIEKFLFT